MNSVVKVAKLCVGVDVSKATLDVYRPDTGKLSKIDNSEEAIEILCVELQKKKRKILVAMEGTGGYEFLLLKGLAAHKLDAAVINPKRVRDFAKGIGLDAKTDPIDAQVISKYAEVVAPKPVAMKSDHELKHSALVARRTQLLELINQESNRLKQSYDDEAKQSIRDVMETLRKQLKSIDSRLATLLQADEENKRTIELVGVAPINRDSGKKSGKRFIGGGRGQVRRVLYMSTVVAIRHNPAIKAFYAHLKAQGKESKVAIVACMRKLITFLSYLLKSNQAWENKMSV